jgi:hypothetical protein
VLLIVKTIVDIVRASMSVAKINPLISLDLPDLLYTALYPSNQKWYVNALQVL